MIQIDSWKNLEQQASNRFVWHEKNLFKALSGANITLDFSAQCINASTLKLLFQLASESKLESMIEALFLGEKVNTSEKRPALHCALREHRRSTLWVGDRNIMPDIAAARDYMHSISEQIRSGEWCGYSNKRITDVINIGIGGSQLGPFFCIHALTEYASPSLSYHFISDMDPIAFTRATSKLNPETTLFIVSSKSFTTMETIYNLKQAMGWINHPDAFEKHFIAVTAYPDRARKFGLKNILPLWDFIGGRYSLFSAINLITCIAIGFEQFSELLKGAQAMDEHFRYTPFTHNLPVHLALLGIWNNNFLTIHQLLLLTYGHCLDYFTPYIQQLDMESNGKSIDKNNRAICYATGPIVWGGSGVQAQHSYYQLLCQGTHRIAIDLISIDYEQESPLNHLCLAQKQVLTNGMYDAQNPNCSIPGNIPINHIRLKDNSPKTLGALIALYEHKIYAQSVIWNINPFDQPGVESSKQLMKRGLSYA